MGRGLKTAGAEYTKNLAPYLLVCISKCLGTISRSLLAECRKLAGYYQWSDCAGYEKANPLSALKTRLVSLNIIVNSIGSQCDDFRTGVICSNFRVPEMILAAFFIKCRSLYGVSP